MQAVKKPTPITVLEIIDMSSVPPDISVERTGNSEFPFQIWNHMSKQWIQFQAGDFLNITNLQDVYPIPKAVFYETYYVVGS